MLNTADLGIGWTILGLAVLPGICEELAFRGFILQGFASSGRKWLAIAASSFLFGAMHILPHQSFNAMILGVPLALLVLHERSLLPAMAFHVVYNGLEIVRGELSEVLSPGANWSWWFQLQEGHLRYGWGTLAIALLVGSALLEYLIRYQSRVPERLIPEGAMVSA